MCYVELVQDVGGGMIFLCICDVWYVICDVVLDLMGQGVLLVDNFSFDVLIWLCMFYVELLNLFQIELFKCYWVGEIDLCIVEGI